MVTTKNTTSHNEQPNHNDTSAPLQNPDNLAQQLSSIASKLNALDALATDVAVLKAQARPNGSNRGKSATLGSRHGDDDSENIGWYRNSTWIPFTKIEFPKFKRGDPRGWILKYFCYYETPDESMVEIASMYIEGDALDLFAWISPRNVLKAVSLALEFEAKSRPTKNPRGPNAFGYNNSSSTFARDQRNPPATSQNTSSLAQCKTSTFLLLEIANDSEQLVEREADDDGNEYDEDINQQDMVEISFHAILGKTSGTIKKIGNGQIIQCNQICRDLSVVFPGLKIREDYFPFSIGGADLVLGIKWLASLNTIPLDLLRNNKIFANAKNCAFGEQKVQFLGHVVSKYGVAVDSEKVQAVLNWTLPPDAKELKLDLTTVPFLRLPNFHEPFTVECDASSAGVGAILLQSEHPIAFFSKGLSFSNRLKSTYDRELLALVLALQKWRHYLLGRHFFVKTDHCSLKHLLAQRVTTCEQQRLLMKLFPFDFTIIYKSGKENQGADALSRRLQHADFMALVLSVNMDFLNLHEALLNEPYTQNIITSISQDPTTHHEFSLSDSKLFYHNRLVILDDSPLRKKLLSKCHDSLIGGHVGYLKTLKRLTENFFWPQMKRDVKTHVQNCMVCQQNKYETLASAGLLQPLPSVWEDISLDFIVGLPKSGGVDMILVVVDRLSKYSHFLPLAHPFTAKLVDVLFCKEIVRLHGYHTSSETTPFKALYSRDQPVLNPYVKGETLNANLEDQLMARDDALQLLRSNLLKAQCHMKAQTSSKRRELSFEVGVVAYELALPEDSKVYLIILVSLLRAEHGQMVSQPYAPLPINAD
ncbi:hypothetical protein Tco_0441625 [Tanacetum coccineum]